MTCALDVGAQAFRSLRLAGPRLITRQFRSIAAWMPDGEMSRLWLDRLGISWFPCDGEYLALPGEAAAQVAQLFPLPYQDLLCDGDVPTEDPVARQLIALAVEAVLPPAEQAGDVCCFTQPAAARLSEAAQPAFAERHEFIARLIRLRGYKPLPLNAGVALALAELEPWQYSGLSVSLGASGGDAVLLHCGETVAQRRLPRGGRWIDTELARALNLTCSGLFGATMPDLEAGRRLKEGTSLESPCGREQELLVDLYRRLIVDVAHSLEELLAEHAALFGPHRSLPVVLGGGVTQMPGFLERVREEICRRSRLAALGAIGLARTGELAVSRGCLIHATLVGRPDSIASRRQSA